MELKAYDEIKSKLASFDYKILESWEHTINIDCLNDTYYSYVSDVINFPDVKESLTNSEIPLVHIALAADPGEDVDLNIPKDVFESKFNFPATPIERITYAVPKKKKSKKKKHRQHGMSKSKSMAPFNPK